MVRGGQDRKHVSSLRLQTDAAPTLVPQYFVHFSVLPPSWLGWLFWFAVPPLEATDQRLLQLMINLLRHHLLEVVSGPKACHMSFNWMLLT